ncbi:hypothetical protein [Photorhabdus asymbiotica]|uniref:hypothetical protein n=1 Tax=Photorhabdus asymbiotica TaxID=291112 RepID=UPI003DA6D890
MSENKRHVHAEQMMQYAQDAFKTDKPWLLWEMYDDANELWEDILHHPNWNPDFKYRRKPEMITVGKISFPKPVDYELKEKDRYFTASSDGVGYFVWRDDNIDYYYLQSGVIHLTKEAAKQHVEAIIKINSDELTRKDGS